MATFYVLPPRASLESALGAFLARFLPGLPLPGDSWDLVADRLGTAAGWPGDVFLIPRDDLPADVAVAEALVSGYGAEPGDQVVETGAIPPRAWFIPDHDESTTHDPDYLPGAVGGPTTLRLIR